jgi:Protein of unknown function (DUF3054)
MPAGFGFASDAALVLGFAAVGRASPQEGNAVVGALATAWPFLVGTIVGWALVRALSHRWPLDVGPGLSVAVVTVVVGMLLRTMAGPGTAPAFVAVATVALAVLLVGWRAAVAWLTARR